ncbi:hypothetical protein GQ53DRAFT_743540 [Thozetella sp. PMI_491]|nr:hypothetical protein GQ53DRAFT_743540 [Thozetella sp. PMI_491]
MLSRLEELPNELLDVILGFSSESSLARLLACNKSLKERAEPALYGRPEAQQRAMLWGCEKARVEVVRLVNSYGGRVSERARVMMQRLCRSRDWPSIRYFYQHGLDEDIKSATYYADCILLLVPLIRAGAPLNIIQLVLERGADPNCLHTVTQRDALCPLSAALTANSEETWRFLIAKGAIIHGRELRGLPRTALHLPIFAAAATMATQHYGCAMMQLSLDAGLDINASVPALAPRPARRHYKHQLGKLGYELLECYYATPLFAFLKSIRSWRSDIGPNPVEGLTWLLEHGATPLVDITVPSSSENPKWLRTHSEGETYTTIDLLLDQWGLTTLTNPIFMGVIKLLAQNGAARGHATRLLLKVDGDLPAVKSRRSPSIDDMKRGRGNLVRALLLEDPEADDKNQVLAEYLQRNVSRIHGFGEPEIAIVDHLLEAGADINARPAGQPDGPTVLHEICRSFNSAERWRPGHWTRDHFLEDKKVPLRQPFLELLRRKGADPTLTSEGKTAADLLVQGIKNLHLGSEKVNGEGEAASEERGDRSIIPEAVEHLSDLASKLRAGGVRGECGRRACEKPLI